MLFGVAVLHMGTLGKQLVNLIDHLTHALFGMVGHHHVRVGDRRVRRDGVHDRAVRHRARSFSLGELMLVMIVACLFFIFGVLGTIAWWSGISLFKYLSYIKEEILIVMGTSSSETVLPRMMAKLEHAGCAKPVVGLVIPTGYSFNLDGTSIYMSMAAIFIAQATNTPLTLGQQLGILAVLLLTSKGAAGVTGSGFITLAATLSSIPALPVAGLALLIGIDRFMSGCALAHEPDRQRPRDDRRREVGRPARYETAEARLRRRDRRRRPRSRRKCSSWITRGTEASNAQFPIPNSQGTPIRRNELLGSWKLEGW